MSEHLCYAEDCTTSVPPALFMCLKHWRMVPKNMQRELNNMYVKGQEITKTPTWGYITVAKRIIEYVKELEHGNHP